MFVTLIGLLISQVVVHDECERTGLLSKLFNSAETLWHSSHWPSVIWRRVAM